MSERGVFAVDRGVWDHELFVDNEPFSRREAWLWLISEAGFREHRRRISGKAIPVARGQVVHSLRFMAAAWRWSEATVRRYLAELIGHNMIVANSDAGVTQITICKYDEYQWGAEKDDAETDAPVTQERRRLEETNNTLSSFLPSSEDSVLEGSRDSEPRAKCNGRAKPDDWPSDYRERFWSVYPNKVGKRKALARLDGARKRGVPWAVLWGGLERYVAKTDDRPWCNPDTWLNQDRWTDEPALSANIPRPGSREDQREKTHHAMQRLRAFANGSSPDDAAGGSEPRGPIAGVLPFSKSA